MTLLYTRGLVQQAADAMGNQRLADGYFEGNPDAFKMVDAMLKDAHYGDSIDGEPEGNKATPPQP